MSHLIEIEHIIENGQTDKFKELLLKNPDYEEFELILFIIIAYEHHQIKIADLCMNAINQKNNTDKSLSVIYNDILQWLIDRGDLEHIKIITSLEPYPISLKTVGVAIETSAKNLNSDISEQIYNIIYDKYQSC